MNTPAKISKVDEIKMTLGKMEEQITGMLPSHISFDRFTGVVITALRMNPKLTESEPNSLYTAVLQAASDGLVPDGREGTIQLYSNKAKWMPMIGGICKLARQSGDIVNIDAIVVYEKDEFDAWVDEHGPHFKYRKARSGDRGKVKLTFGYAITKKGDIFFEEIDEEQMTKIEKVSTSRMSTDALKYSPWKGDFKDEMRRKSVIRRLAKYRLPSSKDLDNVIRREDVDFQEPEVQETDEQSKQENKKSRLETIVDAQATEAVVNELVEEPELEPKEPPKQLSTVTGLIDDIKQSWVHRNGPDKDAEQKFAFKIGKKYYGTFDLKMVAEIAVCADNKIPVEFKYTERKSEGKTFNDIVEFRKLDVPI